MKYFTNKEIACKCGCGFDTLDEGLALRLDMLRELLNRPLIVTSACRCAKHNVSVGGALTSLHTTGQAVDLKANTGKEREEIIRGAMRVGFTGYGVNKAFVHLSYSISNQEGVFVY